MLIDAHASFHLSKCVGNFNLIMIDFLKPETKDVIFVYYVTELDKLSSIKKQLYCNPASIRIMLIINLKCKQHTLYARKYV